MTTGPDDPFRFDGRKPLDDRIRELIEDWRTEFDPAGHISLGYSYQDGISEAFGLAIEELEHLLDGGQPSDLRYT